MNGRGLLIVAALAALCLATGCASRQVVSQDGDVLWTAARKAVQEQGFEMVSTDRGKGEIVATEAAGVRPGSDARRLRVVVVIDRTEDGDFRARVTARRSLAEDSLQMIDKSVRFDKARIGSTGRSMGQYGSVATRDTRLEKALLDRIRGLLPVVASPLTLPPVGP